MRVYFLTEDSKSFFYVLPHWLKYMLPNLREASGMSDFREDSFLVETGGGYPQILRFLQDTIRSFQENEFPPDYFIVCYDTDDADEQKVQHDVAMFASYFYQANVRYPFFILPMRRCFETWLLGNASVWPLNISADFKPYAEHYPVNRKDPEKMEKPNEFEDSNSIYHYRYLQKMLRCSVRKNYSKRSPGYVSNEEYFHGIFSRVDTMHDLHSFSDFLNFVKRLQENV